MERTTKNIDQVKQLLITTTGPNGDKVSDATCSVVESNGTLLGEGITNKAGRVKIKFPSDVNTVIVACSTGVLSANQNVALSENGVTKASLTLSQTDSNVSIPSGTSVPGCEQTNTCYLPFVIFVEVNEMVTWANNDVAAHTVTSGTPQGPVGTVFFSGLFFSGGTFSHIFDEVGVIPYFCIVHPWMQGIVIVEDA